MAFGRRKHGSLSFSFFNPIFLPYLLNIQSWKCLIYPFKCFGTVTLKLGSLAHDDLETNGVILQSKVMYQSERLIVSLNQSFLLNPQSPIEYRSK